jgi:MFS family permease
VKDVLGFSDAVYGFGAGIFFVSYLMFEVPSNLLLERIGVQLTLLRIMVLWGLVSAATMFVSAPWHFYAVRFLLGACEAGFFPGIILYLTYWFPSSRRGLVTGQFMFAIPVAGIVGGPLSGWIMSHMDGVWGWGGWQWMFLLEGLPTALLGVACYFLLTDAPRNAKWLTEREKAVVEAVLNADQGEAMATGHITATAEIMRAMGDARVWILAFVYFATACANYTFTFWLPTMVKNLGVNDIGQIGWYTFFPYVSAALGIIAISWNSDRLRERRWHVAGSAIALSSTTLLGSSLWLTLTVMCVVGFFQFGAGILYWAIPPTYLRKDQAAVGIALISSIGVVGGFVSPTLLGMIKTYTGSLDNGIYVVAGIMVAGAATTLIGLPSRALRVGGVSPTADEMGTA